MKTVGRLALSFVSLLGTTALAGNYHQAPLRFSNGWSINDQGQVAAGAREWTTEPSATKDTYTYLDPDKQETSSKIVVGKNGATILYIAQSAKIKAGTAEGKTSFMVSRFRADGTIAAASICNGYGNCATANNEVCQTIAHSDANEMFLRGKKPSKNFSAISDKMKYCVEMRNRGDLGADAMRSLKNSEEDAGARIVELQGRAKAFWQDLKGDVKLHATSKFLSDDTDKDFGQYSDLIKLCEIQYGNQSAVDAKLEDGRYIVIPKAPQPTKH